MSRKPSYNFNDAYPKILETTTDYILETRRFPGIQEIHKRTNIPENALRQLVETLVRQRQLCVVYRASSHPTLYALPHMMRAIEMSQPKPKWLSDYAFLEKKTWAETLNKAKSEIDKFESIEGLLYFSNTPLEHSVALALNLLDFDKVHHYIDDTDNPDITFEYDNKKYICEVKGVSKSADKEHVAQLNGWIKVELQKDDSDPDHLVGMLFVNHYCNLDPLARGDVLTPHGKKYGKMDRVCVNSTVQLFNTTKEVLDGTRSKPEARMLIAQGENYG